MYESNTMHKVKNMSENPKLAIRDFLKYILKCCKEHFLDLNVSKKLVHMT